MTTLSGNLPTGLRPVSRRLVSQGDLSQQTRRIIIPRAEKPANQPEPVPVPRVVARATPVIVNKFYLFPCVDEALLGLFPNGVRLSAEWLYIGRSPYNDADALLALVLNRDEISKVHAALMEFRGKVYVADLGSSNGTKIIRNQVAYAVGSDPVELMPEDMLSLGSILFRIAQQ